MASLVLTIKGNPDVVSLAKDSSLGIEAVLDIINHLQALAGGHSTGTIKAQTSTANPVSASGTLTMTSSIATDAVTIGTTTLTAKASPANENEWTSGGATDDDDAAELAAVINAHSVLSQIVSATSVGKVVTVSANQPGVGGNVIKLSSADATIVASVANLAGGTGGAASVAKTWSFGE